VSTLIAKIQSDTHKMDIVLKQSTFPAGERYIKILNVVDINNVISKKENYFVKVVLLSASSDAIMDAILLANAIRMNLNGNPIVVLHAPYLPYSRQDRVCSVGESSSLEVILEILSAYYHTIITTDIHNIATLEVCEHLISTDVDYANGDFIEVLGNFKTIDFNTTLLIPDEGALPRALRARRELGLTGNIIEFHKERTEEGIKLKVHYQDIKVEDVTKGIIFDDICDGGGTFIKLAQEILKVSPNAELTLVITHGIFSQGLDELSRYYKNIVVLNTEFNNNVLQYQEYMKAFF